MTTVFIDPITCLEVRDPTHAVYVGTQKEYMEYVLAVAKDEYMTSDLFEVQVQMTKARIPVE